MEAERIRGKNGLTLALWSAWKREVVTLLGPSKNLPLIRDRFYLAEHKKRSLSSSLRYWFRLQIKMMISHFILMGKFQSLEKANSVFIFSLVK